MGAACLFNKIWAWEEDGQYYYFSAGSTLATAILSMLLLVGVIRYFWSTNLPPGPRGLPIIGHIPFLKAKGKENRPLHRIFADLAAEYGPIYKLWIANQLLVLVTSPAVAKQVLRDNEPVFLTRKLPLASDIFTYGGLGVGSLPVGPCWKSMRKALLRDALSNPALNRCYPLRRRHVVAAIKRVGDQLVRQPVHIFELAYKIVANATLAMTWGGGAASTTTIIGDDDGIDFGSETRKLLKQLMGLMGKPNVSDVFPMLARFDMQGVQREAAEAGQRFDRILTSVIGKRLSTLDHDVVGNGSNNNVNHDQNGDQMEVKDLLQVLLEVRAASGPGSPLESMTNFKALLLDIVLGGTENISNTIEWTMAELLNNGKAMKMVKQELDEIVGLDNLVEDCHLRKLNYLDAVVKETCRLHQTLFQRKAARTCTVAGYTIPEGSKVIVNAWAIHRDPRSWDDPLEFRPERFLVVENGSGRSFDFMGSNSGFEYLPFGSGRRVCPGINLADRMLKYVLASLLHSFDWKPVGGEEDRIDLSDAHALFIKKKKRLIAVPTPRRLPSSPGKLA